MTSLNASSALDPILRFSPGVRSALKSKVGMTKRIADKKIIFRSIYNPSQSNFPLQEVFPKHCRFPPASLDIPQELVISAAVSSRNGARHRIVPFFEPQPDNVLHCSGF